MTNINYSLIISCRFSCGDWILVCWSCVSHCRILQLAAVLKDCPCTSSLRWKVRASCVHMRSRYHKRVCTGMSGARGVLYHTQLVCLSGCAQVPCPGLNCLFSGESCPAARPHLMLPTFSASLRLSLALFFTTDLGEACCCCAMKTVKQLYGEAWVGRNCVLLPTAREMRHLGSDPPVLVWLPGTCGSHWHLHYNPERPWARTTRKKIQNSWPPETVR